MSTLNGQFIAETFSYLLKTDNTSLSSGKATRVEDGLGNPSNLILSPNGVGVLGQLSASGFKYPTQDPGGVNNLLVQNTNTIGLSSLAALLAALGVGPDGTYSNPTLTLSGGLIVSIQSGSSTTNAGLSTFTIPGQSVFIVPPNVRRVKFTVTGGGGAGPRGTGGAGGSIIGYLTVTPGQQIGVTVGIAGIEPNGAGGQSNISIDGTTIVYATGGNTTNSGVGLFGGGTGGVNNPVYVQSYYIVPGGAGGVETDGNQNNEAGTGASSIWGCGPAWGGGASADSGISNRFRAGNGIVLFEW